MRFRRIFGYGQWFGDRFLKNILGYGVILNSHQKSCGGRRSILIGGVFLYRMILVAGFYCSGIFGLEYCSIYGRNTFG